MSFIKYALEVTEKAIEQTEHSIDEYETHRKGAKLFLKLGIAVYAEERLDGIHAPVERILSALDGHAAEHGEVDLDHLRAAHEVLGDEFIEEHEIGAKAEVEEEDEEPAPKPHPAAKKAAAHPAAKKAAAKPAAEEEESDESEESEESGDES